MAERAIICYLRIQCEGLNRIIRMVKNRASGFKTLDALPI